MTNTVSEDRVVELLDTINKQHSERQDAMVSLQKQSTEAIEALSKQNTELTKQNQVLSERMDAISETLKTAIPGTTMENNPKGGGSMDVGDKVKAPNELAPGQPGPEKTAPMTNDSGSDRGGLSMENKAFIEETIKAILEKTFHDKKEDMKDDKKEDMAKAEDMEDDDDEKEDEMKKSAEPAAAEVESIVKTTTIGNDTYEYEKISAVRPAYTSNENLRANDVEGPNGYQLIKAIQTGWGKRVNDLEQSYKMAAIKVQELEQASRGA